MLERVSSWVTYSTALLMAKIGHFSLQDTATVIGIVLGVVMCLINIGRLLINWHYRRRALQLLSEGKITREHQDELKR